MKKVHHIFARVFSYANRNDSNEMILEKFRQLFPFNLEEEKIIIKTSEAQGFSDSKITVYEIILGKERHINKFLNYLKENFSEEDKKSILFRAGSRLDKDLDFFLRIDREEFIKSGRLMLTDSGNCFHIKMSIAAFPKNMETALKIVNEIFSS